MAIYTPNKQLITAALDEHGKRVAMRRLPDETLAHYRRRILLEMRRSGGPTEIEAVNSVAVKIGLLEVPLFEVDLIRDANDMPLALDPLIETKATKMYVWHDKENDLLDFEINLTDSLMEDVWNAFDASTYFDVTSLDSEYEEISARNVKSEYSLGVRANIFLPRNYMNKLQHSLIKEFRPSNPFIFAEEKASLNLLNEEGDYYVDYVNGTVFSHSLQEGTCFYQYYKFPFKIMYQPVKVYSYLDETINNEHKDNQLNEFGAEEPLLLNSKGAYIANRVLEVHGMTWGK